MTVKFEAGNKEANFAAYNKACQYESGVGVLRDVNLAINMLFDLAMAGFVNAQTKLCRNYADRVQPRCQELAAKGSAEALLMLGRICRYREDHLVAFQYFKQAADKDNADAIFYVGDAYMNGRGVKRDYEEALKYFTISNDRGEYLALGNLGTLLAVRETPIQNIPLGIQYLKEAAEKGDPAAQLNLANIYMAGVKVPRDVPAALSIYENLAEKGKTLAYIKMARYYYQEKDYVKALTYCEKAWNAGDDNAMKEVAKMHLRCADLVEGMPLRLECLQFAVARGDQDAMYLLSRDYFEGKNVTRSVMTGITYLEKAALAGHPLAQQKLAALGDTRFKTENEA